MLALGLRCERLIYTAFVNLCHKHEDNMGSTLSDCFHEHSLASTTPDKTSTVSVFRLSLVFKTGVDC